MKNTSNLLFSMSGIGFKMGVRPCTKWNLGGTGDHLRQRFTRFKSKYNTNCCDFLS